MGDFDRSNSEQLIDLHVYIVPPDLWRTHLRSAVNQIIDETISAGFIRVHPETSVNALRKELEIQLEYDASDYPMPAEYVFLKCVGRCLTQVKPRQEYTLKIKNFQLPTTLAAEIYVLDAIAAGVRYTPYSGSSSQSSSVRYNGTPRSDRSEFSGHKPIPPIRRSHISTQTNGPGLSNEEQQKLDDLLRRKREEEEEEERKRREWEEEQERRRREEEQERFGEDDDESEEERRRREEEARLDEERRRQEEERRRREEERRRLEEERRRQEEEESKNRDNSRRTPGGRSLSELRQELEQVRQERLDAEKRREDLVKKARLLQNKAQQRRNQADPVVMGESSRTRDLWKKKYFEEKKRTAPLEEQCNKLRNELEALHRKIMAQLDNNKETFRRPGDNKPSQQSNLRMQAARLQHDIDDIQRRVENVKMKLTTEMKLKNQAEGELKALRAELTQKKINVTLARSQPYTPVPMLTPRS